MIDGLDSVIHEPKRLAAMAVLARATTAEFAFPRAHLDVSDSDLSKQRSTLDVPHHTGGPGGVRAAPPGAGRHPGR